MAEPLHESEFPHHLRKNRWFYRLSYVCVVAMFELFGEMPAPEFGDGGVRIFEEVVDLLQEELGLDDASAFKTLAVGEIPCE